MAQGCRRSHLASTDSMGSVVLHRPGHGRHPALCELDGCHGLPMSTTLEAAPIVRHIAASRAWLTLRLIG